MLSNHNRNPDGEDELDEVDDYQVALKLYAELNGEHVSSPIPDSDYDDDAAFARAMQEELDNEASAMAPAGSAWSSEPVHGRTAWGGHDESKVVEYLPETPSSRLLKTFEDFTAHILSSKCPKCGTFLFKTEIDVKNMFEAWLAGKTTLSSWIKCTRCANSSCISCTPQAYTKPSTVSYQGKNLAWCCAGGRLVLIWLLLCGFDQHFCASRSKGADKAQPGPPTKETQKRGKSKGKLPSRGGGVGFGGARPPPSLSYMPSGKGYGTNIEDMYDEMYGGMGEWMASPNFKGQGHVLDSQNPIPNPQKDSKAMAHSAQQADDEFNRLVLEVTKELLPSYNRDGNFEMDPPEAVTDMLLHSKILNYCAELLRNDSLDDATKRKELYYALISFLQTIGTHIMATRAIFSERVVFRDAVNLLTLSFGAAADGPKDTASSIADCLRNLNSQSVLAIQQARSNEKDFRTQDGQNMLLLCRQITEFSQYIHVNANGASSDDGNAAAEDLSMMEVPDDDIMPTHAYSVPAKALRFSPPGRFKRLITEITTLKTGLPPGIFVRYCENRPDILKVAIIGPGGTPYENGIFEFDFYCKENFPNGPPSVEFRGTGGGRVSINPNLYADGKVCLSLLGTWQGEPWVPNESTLLQVVISLQAMILCEEPWYNEPGREMGYKRDFSAAEAYHQKIRTHTLQYGILAWLEQDPPSALWKAVVAQHFTQNANKILQTAEAWANSKTPPVVDRPNYDFDEDFAAIVGRAGRVSPDFGTIISRLQAALGSYGGTHVVKYTPPPPSSPPPGRVYEHSLYTPSKATHNSYVPSHEFSPLPDIPPILPPGYSPGLHPRGGRGGHGGRGGRGERGRGNFFQGIGQVLGGAFRGGHSTGPTSPHTAPPGGRGESVLGPVTDTARGRYETRSSTRGRGGPGQGQTGGSSASSQNPALPTYSGVNPFWSGAGFGGRGGFGRGGSSSDPG